MGPKYIETPYISNHIGPMYIETPNIAVKWVSCILRYPVYPCISLSARAGCDTRSIFEADFNRFEFRVFFLLDRLSNQS